MIANFQRKAAVKTAVQRKLHGNLSQPLGVGQRPNNHKKVHFSLNNVLSYSPKMAEEHMYENMSPNMKAASMIDLKRPCESEENFYENTCPTPVSEPHFTYQDSSRPTNSPRENVRSSYSQTTSLLSSEPVFKKFKELPKDFSGCAIRPEAVALTTQIKEFVNELYFHISDSELGGISSKTYEALARVLKMSERINLTNNPIQLPEFYSSIREAMAQYIGSSYSGSKTSDPPLTLPSDKIETLAIILCGLKNLDVSLSSQSSDDGYESPKSAKGKGFTRMAEENKLLKLTVKTLSQSLYKSEARNIASAVRDEVKKAESSDRNEWLSDSEKEDQELENTLQQNEQLKRQVEKCKKEVEIYKRISGEVQRSLFLIKNQLESTPIVNLETALKEVDAGISYFPAITKLVKRSNTLSLKRNRKVNRITPSPRVKKINGPRKVKTPLRTEKFNEISMYWEAKVSHTSNLDDAGQNEAQEQEFEGQKIEPYTPICYSNQLYSSCMPPEDEKLYESSFDSNEERLYIDMTPSRNQLPVKPKLSSKHLSPVQEDMFSNIEQSVKMNRTPCRSAPFLYPHPMTPYDEKHLDSVIGVSSLGPRPLPPVPYEDFNHLYSSPKFQDANSIPANNMNDHSYQSIGKPKHNDIPLSAAKSIFRRSGKKAASATVLSVRGSMRRSTKKRSSINSKTARTPPISQMTPVSNFEMRRDSISKSRFDACDLHQTPKKQRRFSISTKRILPSTQMSCLTQNTPLSSDEVEKKKQKAKEPKKKSRFSLGSISMMKLISQYSNSHADAEEC